MDNALKYSPAGSVIRVSLTKKGKRIQLEVYNEIEPILQGNLIYYLNGVEFGENVWYALLKLSWKR